MRIVILSDSMGMPRPWLDEEERTNIDEVYGGLLRERYRGCHDVDLLYVISLDSDNAAIRYHRMVSYREPDIVILHLGINDCAPRVFRRGSRSVLLKPWFRAATRDAGMRFINRYRRGITRLRRRVYTTLPRFERNMRSIVEGVREHNADAVVLGIAIMEVADTLDERSYGYLENIRAYNAVLRRVLGDGFVEVADLGDKDRLLISDGYHLSAEAHRLLADRLGKRIDALAQLRSMS